jgi:hypothetical protein
MNKAFLCISGIFISLSRTDCVYWGSHGCDCMVVGFTTTYAISAYHHWCCEFESWSGRGVQHYVLKFDMTCDRSVIFSTNKTDCHDITEILLKVALNTIKQTNRLCIHSIAERQKRLTSSILAIISTRTNSTIKCLIVMRQFSFYL